MKKVFSLLLVLGIAFSASDVLWADILVKEVRSSDGKGSTEGYVYQHDRSSYRNTSRSRRTRDPVISENPGMIQVAPISQFTSYATTPEVPPRGETKPRFGYGSDYRSSQSEKSPRVSPEGSQAAPDGKSAPVPPSTYPDSDIPAVPSYSDPNPNTVPRSDSQRTPAPQGRIEPSPFYRDPSPSDRDPPKIVGELLRALPSILARSEFAPREVETRHLRERVPPRIEFNFAPPVHREYLPVVPHFFDPYCGPFISTPFGYHGSHSFGNGFVTPFGYSRTPGIRFRSRSVCPLAIDFLLLEIFPGEVAFREEEGQRPRCPPAPYGDPMLSIDRNCQLTQAEYFSHVARQAG